MASGLRSASGCCRVIARRELLVASDFQGSECSGRSSRDTFRIRDFLAGTRCVHWIDVDHDPQVGALLQSFGSRGRHAGGRLRSEPLLRNPSTRHWPTSSSQTAAHATGLRLGDRRGGPADWLAVYASSEGWHRVIDATAPEDRPQSSKIENYLGFPQASPVPTREPPFCKPEIRRPVSSLQLRAWSLRKQDPRVRQRACLDSMLVDPTGAEYRKLDVPKRTCVFNGLRGQF